MFDYYMYTFSEENITKNLYLALGIIIGVIIAYILIEIKKKCWISTPIVQYKKEVIKILLTQALRYYNAAKQDENPLIAVLHGNYQAAYLWALNDIATTEEIEAVAEVPYNFIKKHVQDVQHEVTNKMSKICPKFSPEKSILTKLAGEGF